jgi:very-short-patch-repair endonuclease
MEINLPKRSEIKKYRPERSESPQEQFIKEILLKTGCREFRQQYEIKGYFADFAIPSMKLVIEYDGEVHIGREFNDRKRSEVIRGEGWKILRIKNWGNEWEITLNGKTVGWFFRNSAAMDFLSEYLTDLIYSQRLNDSNWIINQASENHQHEGFVIIKDLVLKRKMEILSLAKRTEAQEGAAKEERKQNKPQN